MTRLVAVVTVAVVVCVAGLPTDAGAQPRHRSSTSSAAPAAGQVHGTVVDEQRRPLKGVAVSIVGQVSASAVSDRDGRFLFASLPPGPYLIRTHLDGFLPVRATLVQVDPASRVLQALQLFRPTASRTLAAGVGSPEAGSAVPGADTDAPESGEVAWRLRHLRRGVLEQATAAVTRARNVELSDQSVRGQSGASLDLPFSGQINLLTGTTFDRPQQLLSRTSGAPHGVAYGALQAPTPIGAWHLRGALTEGDLSSWTLAGAFVRNTPVAHAYEAGVAYTMQRYDGVNAAALAAMPDGSRNAGVMYARDRWTVHPRVSVEYGARYARYDYLEGHGLFSPEAAVSLKALGTTLRGLVSSRATAPGAAEFEAPGGTDMWMPPERTFASVTQDGSFRRERTSHAELSAQRAVAGGLALTARVFAQRVDDQLSAMFGLSLPHAPASGTGHYYVASMGDVKTTGWAVGVSRPLAVGVRGSVEYSEGRANWQPSLAQAGPLASRIAGLSRGERERLRDLAATVEATVPQTATRVFVFYRVNAAGSQEAEEAAPQLATRFDLQVRQGLPFLNFTSADWAMLVTIRNVFTQGAADASVYDELLVINPPKRIVGGLTVRF